jgi:hypothetical protein
LKEEVLNFQIPPLERSPSAQPCSSVSWEQNGYYAAQGLLVLHISQKETPNIWIEDARIPWHNLTLYDLISVHKFSVAWKPSIVLSCPGWYNTTKRQNKPLHQVHNSLHFINEAPWSSRTLTLTSKLRITTPVGDSSVYAKWMGNYFNYIHQLIPGLL